MANDIYSYSIHEDDKEGQELYKQIKQHATTTRKTMSGIILQAFKLYLAKEVKRDK